MCRGRAHLAECVHLRVAPQGSPPPRCLAPRYRGHLAGASIFAPGPEKIATATVPCTAYHGRLEGAGIVALHRNVGPPPRCLAPVVDVLQAQASLLCTAKSGHRHSALHRAIVGILHAYASSRSIAEDVHRQSALHHAIVDVLHVQASLLCTA